MGKPGLGPAEAGKLKLLVAGDPAREVVIASCCMGISNACGLGANPWLPRSDDREGLKDPGSSYRG